MPKRLDNQFILKIAKRAAEERGVDPAALLLGLASALNGNIGSGSGPTVEEWAERHMERKKIMGKKDVAGRKTQLSKLTGRYGGMRLTEFTLPRPRVLLDTR